MSAVSKHVLTIFKLSMRQKPNSGVYTHIDRAAIPFSLFISLIDEIDGDYQTNQKFQSLGIIGKPDFNKYRYHIG